MLKRFVPFAILAMGLLLAASVAWTADGENIFQFAYSHADSDPNADSAVRGVCAGSDLDQDGKYEIIITDYDNGGMVHVYEVVANDSIEHVWSSAGSNGTTNCRQVHTGDMDNDGIGEIIFVTGDGTWSATYEGGIHVYEWDGITDNGYGAAAASIYKPNPTHQERFRTEDFTIGDVDGDGENELVTCDNTLTAAQDGLYILSVTGDFQ
ncbi:VCBS repeat-containing protein, partial [bacterium]|nr:VCBS repeat-containing protein [bacterium]